MREARRQHADRRQVVEQQVRNCAQSEEVNEGEEALAGEGGDLQRGLGERTDKL